MPGNPSRLKKHATPLAIGSGTTVAIIAFLEWLVGSGLLDFFK